MSSTLYCFVSTDKHARIFALQFAVGTSRHTEDIDSYSSKKLFFPYALLLSRVKMVAGNAVKWKKCTYLFEVALYVFLTQNSHLHIVVISLSFSVWHVNASTEIQTETYRSIHFSVAYVHSIKPKEKTMSALATDYWNSPSRHPWSFIWQLWAICVSELLIIVSVFKVESNLTWCIETPGYWIVKEQ